MLFLLFIEEEELDFCNSWEEEEEEEDEEVAVCGGWKMSECCAQPFGFVESMLAMAQLVSIFFRIKDEPNQQIKDEFFFPM